MVSVIESLPELGPNGPRKPASLPEAKAYCRNLTVGHYENFHVATWLLPKSLRPHFQSVYAYCRWADDLGDEVHNPDESRRLLDWWERELNACYDGSAWHPVFVALKPTIDEFDIPREPFADLLSAFRQDQTILVYDTFEQLRDYCQRSADPVGRLVLHLCRQVSNEHLAWSDAICTGLQLANHWQDVQRDHAIGRVYLPREDRERFGYSDADLAAERVTDAFRDLMRFEVDRARDLLQSGLPLVERMPGRLRIDIDLFIRGGLRILEKIEAINYDVWSQRPKVTGRDALGLLSRSIARSMTRPLFQSHRSGSPASPPS